MKIDNARLVIPEAAYDAFIDAAGSDTPQLSIEAIAAPVVAAELRRIADEIARSLSVLPTTSTADDYFYAGVRDTADGLLRRADELDPPPAVREED